MNNISKFKAEQFFKDLDLSYELGDLDKIEKIFEDYGGLAQEEQNYRALISVFSERMGYYRVHGKKEQTLEAIRETIVTFGKVRGELSAKEEAILDINIATSYAAISDYEEAFFYFGNAERIMIDLGMTYSFEFAALLNNKGATMVALGKWERAREEFNRALEILRCIGKHEGEEVLSLSSLARVYFEQGDLQSADMVLRKAKDIAKNSHEEEEYIFQNSLAKCKAIWTFFEAVDR